MKAVVIFLSLHLFVTPGYSENERRESTSFSSTELLRCNPLKNIHSFAIHPCLIVPTNLRARIYATISKELSQIGKVVHLTILDGTGYGKAQAQITLLFKDIYGLKERKFPIVEISLLVASETQIKKTNTNCSTYIWSAHSIADENIDEKNEKPILDTTRALVRQFIEEYKEINKEQKETPTFYLYQS